MNERSQKGRASIDFSGTLVVPADAIALLSGVNFGSVEKVLAAINVMSDFSGVDAEQIVKFADVPLQRVNPSDAKDNERAGATGSYCQAIAACATYNQLEHLLHLRGRFSNRKTP